MTNRKRSLNILLIAGAACAAYCSFMLSTSSLKRIETGKDEGVEGVAERGEEAAAVDNDWFMLQRVYPHDDINPALYENARQNFRQSLLRKTAASTVPWVSIGPTNIGGRMTAIALDPTNSNIIYTGAAGGGVWKSVDGGASWKNIFSESSSIGSIVLSPGDPRIVYVGTGEANPGGVAIYPGNGVWRSTDGGETWTNLGLANSGQIGKLAIHPAMPNRVFAAVLGRYRSRTQDRGVYRSLDSGLTWSRILFLTDTTGACDLVIDPSNPDRILAAMWDRYRPLTYSILTGTNTSLWNSSDGGDHWTKVTSGFPNNDANLGRVSLAFAPSQAGLVYALASNGLSVYGIYKSTDSGTNWTQVSSGNPFGSESQVWYNNVIAVHPTNPLILFAGMTVMYESTDGGLTWNDDLIDMHVDQHAIEFDHTTPNRIVVGNDGGVFFSTNTGASWVKSYHLPVTQFYAGTIDYSNPERYFGGTQDNGTPRTLTGSDSDWVDIYGGDGFYVLVDPNNSNKVYAEYQYGGLGYSTDGGATFYDGTAGIDANDRKNWEAPFAMDPTTTTTLYTGTQRLYKTTNGMQSWDSISGDLTRGANGRIGSITAIDVARTDPKVVYVGTDDAKVSVTTNGGKTWTDVTGSLPLRWVTRVTVDPDSANVAYVTQSGYLEDNFLSHLNKTTDFGGSWVNIGAGLPAVPLNDIVVDPRYRGYLYVATDLGVEYSSDAGATWNALGTGMPEVPVHDLALHPPTNKLLAFTHGRSAYALDLSSITSVTSLRGAVAGEFQLDQNYPNPFNPTTTLRFSIPSPQFVTLRIYDTIGREVSILVNEELQPGSYTVQWNATAMASGVYFCRLNSGNSVQTKKMLLIR
jgi:photosystem II stability/assembly factor-like uncharacterized protein